MTYIKNTVGFNLFKKVFFMYLIITILVTLFHMYSEYKNEENKILWDMNNIEESFKKQLTTAAWFVDNSLIEEVIYGILSSRSIVGISIKYQDNYLQNYGRVDPKNKYNSNLLDINKLNASYEENLLGHSFVLHDKKYNHDKNLGTVVLYSDKKIIFENVKNNFMLIIINSFIKTLALWIIFLFFANKYLTKQFLEIIDITNNIDFSKIKKTNFIFNKKTKDEFDLLKQSFNIVFKKLANSYIKLNVVNQKNIDLNESLEIKIKERTSELVESNDELEQTIINLKRTQDKLIESEKMAGLGNLVAGVAHEINTPVGIGLTGISHFSVLTDDIEKKYQSNDISREEFEDYINISKELARQINVSLTKTAHLVRSFKQIAVDQSHEEKREFNLKEYIDEVIFSLNNMIKQTNIKINVKQEGDMVINSCAGLYSQIITNLIINSIKHAYKDNNKGVINIDILRENNSLQIIYKDNGKGIKKENLPKIFEPFFTTNREYGGTGLGLNIIYNVITSQLKGTIRCDSIEGKGAIFTIFIKDIF